MTMTFNFSQLHHMKNGLNAVRIYAQLGNESAVDTYLGLGEPVADAVYGYALGGFTNKVNALLQKHPTLVNHAVTAYARANKPDAIDHLFVKDKSLLEEAALLGYAQAANMTQINAALKAKNKPHLLSIVVKGLAQCNHRELVMRYALSIAHQNIAIEAAAESGHAALVTALLASQSIDLATPVSIKENQKSAIEHALVGYSYGRHYTLAAKLLAQNLNPMLCLTAIGQNTIELSDLQALIISISDKTIQQKIITLAKNVFNTNYTAKNTGSLSDNLALDTLFHQAFAHYNQAAKEQKNNF